MFNKGLIITNAFTVWDCVHHMVNRIKDEFAQFGIEMDVKSNSEILVYIDSNGNVNSSKMPYDFIVFLDKDYYISTMLEKAGYRMQSLGKLVKFFVVFYDLLVSRKTVGKHYHHIICRGVSVNAYHVKRGLNVGRKRRLKHLR